MPIADLIGQQITTIIPHITAENAYATIAVCTGQIKSSIACPRLHQLLYNDIVEVIKTVDDEACIRIAHAYYLIPSTSTPQNHYWTLKKNITFLDDPVAPTIPITHIPEPINFSDTNHHALHHPDIVTLTEPHYDSTLHLTFSAATRFVKTPSPQKKRASSIEVFAIDYIKMKEHKIKIPCHKCIVDDTTKTKEERISDYVNLLKKWAHTKNGSIPYVWGGTSFSKTISSNFKEVATTGHNGDYSFYEYEKDTQIPKSGFDCSGVILRAAQICGIPYFCKNTTTIAQCLTPLSQKEQLQTGDLILIKGHVMVVSDIVKNLLIEARSYGHGYGKLHEVPISEVFEGIENYKDLTDACFDKKIIKRKDKLGKVRDTFSSLQLFSMTSTWDKPVL
ncbi:MAG TPA: hypothetical protein VJJ26_01385 [Candidatus Babeliales bacterium]|nr:hypothetical protein [Candidatus Babeliales bacterium]